jgi:hypothetical protein
MLPLDGTACTADVVLEIAEMNEDLVSFRMVSFAAQSLSGFTQGEDKRKYFWLYASPKIDLRTSLSSLRDESAKADGEVIGLTSIVRARSGSSLHMPQLDFRVPPSGEALALIREKFRTVMTRAKSGKIVPGYILLSGKSYHYLGLEPLREEEWLEFMGLALLFEDGADPNRFSPVDRRWIGHSLVRGFSTLRIFGGKKEIGVGELELRPEPHVAALIE